MKNNPFCFLSYILILVLTSSVPIHAQWVSVSSPPANFRTDHTYGFALNGMGYLVAGTDADGNYTDSFFQYDPQLDEFTQLDDFPGGARGYAIGDTWNGKAYFGFGLSTGSATPFKNDLWEFDPTTQTWTELAECPCEARIHPAMVAQNGKIFVGMGGGTFGDLKDWWIYDIDSNSWTAGTDFPSLQRHHPYQFGIGDYVYTGFGHGGPNIYNTWYRYDPATDNWDQMESLPAQGRVAGTQFSWNGKGYILSGEGEDHSSLDEGEFWSYDPDTDSWEQLPSHPNRGRWAPASFVLDDEVYLFNGVVNQGFGSSSHPDDSYKYDLTGGSMTSTNNTEKENSFTLYPNPANDYLNIESSTNIQSDAPFLVLDVLGNTVLSFEATNHTTINISTLANGIYFVQQTETTNAVRFVVNR